MIVFPNAKINLGLNIVEKRPDGFHELETCFYPAPWREALEIVESDRTVVTTSGIEIPDDGENIVLRAYYLLKDDYELPPVHIHLHKVIPIGAGLGGGSADAAFTLMLLNTLYSLNINHDDLVKYAVRLGADCAFFINNRPLLASGIGEQFTDLDISLSDKFIILVYPNIHIPTKEAYSSIDPKMPSVRINEILVNADIQDWKELLKNDFEKPLFKKHLILKDIKANLYNAGAIYASMSGSGSCIYGLFDEDPALIFPENYKVCSGRL